MGIDVEIDVKDISPLNSLFNLQYLAVTNVKPEQFIDFSNLRQLVECNIIWSECLLSIGFCEKLEDLTIWEFDKNNLLELKNIHSLKSLALYNCLQLSDLTGIEFLINLQDLLLYNCKKLVCIEKVKLLFGTLTDLSISKSKKISDYSFIGELGKLANLTIMDSAPASDAKFMEALKSLEYGNINIDILDGQVENILSMPVKFKNYNHFSHKNIHQLKMNSEGNYVLVKKKMSA